MDVTTEAPSCPRPLSYPRPLTTDGQPDARLCASVRGRPVTRVDGPGGPAWLVSGHDEVREVLSDPSRFTSVVAPDVTDARARAGISLVGMDPPEHTRLRRLAAHPFTARRIGKLRPEIEDIVNDLVDTMLATGPPADLLTAMAIPVPLRVMCHMLDLPAADQPDFLRWSEVYTGMSDQSAADTARATQRLHDYMTALTAERRDSLGDDILSTLIRARDGDDAMTEDELLATMVLLLVAGHQTTVRAIARGVLVLLTTGNWQRFVAGELDVDDVVEEVLRHQSPTDAGLFRRVAVDTELGGIPMARDDQVFVAVHLANVDPDVWPRPTEFDPARPSTTHLAFGHGIHFCLGAALARAELTVTLSALAARLQGLRLDASPEDIEWTTASWLNGPVRLPVAW